MSIPTDPSTVALPDTSVPVTLSAEEIYDSLMVQIEPELVTAQLPLLKEKYKDETPGQKAERGLRYKKAHELYDKKFAEFQSTLHGKVHTFKKQAMKDVEAKERAQEESELTTIESALAAE